MRCQTPSPKLRLEGGTLDSMYRITRAEGFSTLWRGFGPTLAQSIPATALYFVAYDELSASLGALSGFGPAVAGALARTSAASLVSPVELIRTRMQAHRGHTESAWTLLKDVTSQLASDCRTRGVKTLFRGLKPTLLRDVPFSAIYWSGFELLHDRSPDLDAFQSFWSSLFAGSVSGAFAAAITTPFDVVKTRAQIQMHSNATVEQGTFSTMRSIVAKEGVCSLFVGVVPRVAKVAPACAIMISSYGIGKRFFES